MAGFILLRWRERRGGKADSAAAAVGNEEKKLSESDGTGSGSEGAVTVAHGKGDGGDISPA
jgi:hypothetical protein